MPERGYIRFYRAIFTHPVFRDEPFTEREAWAWLIAQAAWKPRRQRIGEHLINLQRGEVVGAVRYLATEWRWSKGKVDRFLQRLKNETMVDTQTGTGITVITICKYNDYQGGDDDSGTEVGHQPENDRDTPGTAPGQRRDGVGDNRKELNNSRIEEGEELKTDSREMTLFGGDAESAPPIDYQAMFVTWYGIYPKKVDPDDAEKAFTRALKKVRPSAVEALFEAIMAGTRRYAEEIARDRKERKFIKAPAVFMNKGSWKNEAGAPGDHRPARSGRVQSALDGIASVIEEEGGFDR